jgi:hypothetical protein
MIIDRTIVSARAEKQSAPRRRMVRGILTASMAAILTLPSLAAWGMESPGSNLKSNVSETIALSPNRLLDSVPWLNWNAGVKVDNLLSPIPDPSGIKLGPDQRDKEKPAVS